MQKVFIYLSTLVILTSCALIVPGMFSEAWADGIPFSDFLLYNLPIELMMILFGVHTIAFYFLLRSNAKKQKRWFTILFVVQTLLSFYCCLLLGMVGILMLLFFSLFITACFFMGKTKPDARLRYLNYWGALQLFFLLVLFRVLSLF